MNRICIRARVSGIVQGVSFRAYTQREALRLGLTGYAHNLADGRVEVLACGEENDIQLLLKWLERGSPKASVTGVETETLPWQERTEFATG